MTRYVYIAIACGLFIAALYTFHKSGVHQGYLRGIAEQENKQIKANEQLVADAVKQAEKDWIAANKHIEVVTETKFEVREIVKNVVEKVEVPIDTCTYLGDNWLPERNAVINHLREKNPQ